MLTVVAISYLVADHSSIVVCPSIITHWTVGSIVAHLNSASVEIVAIDVVICRVGQEKVSIRTWCSWSRYWYEDYV